MPTTATSVTSEELARLMARFLMSSVKTAQAEVFRVVEDLELSMTQLKILHIVDGAERELAPSELAQFVGVSPAATGRAVDALVRADLMTRRDDDADRRVKRLALTPSGAAAVSRITEARVAVLAKVVSKLNAQQRGDLAAALAPLLPDSPTDPACAMAAPAQEASPA